jgi:hypothetical protein
LSATVSPNTLPQSKWFPSQASRRLERSEYAACDVQKWTVQAKIEQSSRLLRRYA